MASGYSIEQDAIESRFAAQWTTTLVKYPNVPFIEPSTPWVSLSILPATANRADMGSNNPRRRYVGVIAVQIFVPENTGEETALDYAETIAGIWQDAEFTSGGWRFRCHEPERFMPTGTPVAGWHQVNIHTPFWRDNF